MRPLRGGIVGAGAWAVAAHIPAFQACAGVEIIAICDTDSNRAGEAAEGAGIKGVHASVEAMLGSERLDLVSIATPPASHKSAASVCLAAGVHVLCEKPLGYTVAEARAMA